MKTQKYEIVLASASPRRKALLENIGMDFSVAIAECDESIEKNTLPHEAVMLLSLKKAAAVAKCFEGKEKLIIGADTVVVLNDEILTKPKDEEDAFLMLKKLSGKIHRVLTGVTVMSAYNSESTTVFEETKVHFKELTDEEIRGYISTKECMDKAGSYGIQGIGSMFIEKIDGDYFNVVGLPVCRLCDVLKKEFNFNVIEKR